jgi:hypothetical protein
VQEPCAIGSDRRPGARTPAWAARPPPSHRCREPHGGEWWLERSTGEKFPTVGRQMPLLEAHTFRLGLSQPPSILGPRVEKRDFQPSRLAALTPKGLSVPPSRVSTTRGRKLCAIPDPSLHPRPRGSLPLGASLLSVQARPPGPSPLPARPAVPPARRCRAPRDICCPQAARPDVGLTAEAVLSPSKPGQPYGPRGEQQCPGPFTSKAAIRGKAPPENFFLSLFSLSFLVKKKGISNCRARASLMPFDGD